MYNPEIDVILKQSKLLIREKKYDEAFCCLQRATLQLVKLNQFNYLLYSTYIAELQAKINYKEKPPKYADYLYYKLYLIMLEFFRKASWLETFWYFEELKEIRINNPMFYFDDPKLDTALTELKMIGCKASLVSELFDFAINKFPEMYGIPQNFKFSDISEGSYEKIGYYTELFEKLQKRFLGRDLVEISKFVSLTIKKYYDLCHSTKPA